MVGINYLIFYLFSSFFITSNTGQGTLILNAPGYPVIFELNTGEYFDFEKVQNGNNVKKTVKLLSVKHSFEPNDWFQDEDPPKNFLEAIVEVDVDGTVVNLLHRPYQMPVVVNGLRLFVETTKEWAGGLAEIKNINKQVRLSAQLEGESWGPDSFLFPVKDYRWRAATYNNTWSSLVPFNLMYYHRGEDYGAIPDHLNVIAPFDGTIIQSPVPDGDGKSNSLSIVNAEGISVTIAHMNIETILPGLIVGKIVKKGELLGKTGMTWDGRKSQINDPHVHIEFSHQENYIASFPFLMEAYLRDYEDEVLAVAGGYRFSRPGLVVELDATRSLTKPRFEISDYEWKLSNGQTINSSTAKIIYPKPGLYSEELIVKTKDGKEDRDFLQVRIYDPQYKKDVAYGWGYFNPVREPKAGSPVLFWNRLVNTNNDVVIDFGDGTTAPIEREIEHVYQKSGLYTVTLSASGPGNEPVTVKFEVKVF